MKYFVNRLLDPDRFEGRYREGVHSTDTTGLMRRMVKEDLLTFEGRPFVHEVAQRLPEPVIDYVRLQISAVRA